MFFSPEVAYWFNIAFFSLFALSLGFFMTGLIAPLSKRPTLLLPSDAFPAMCSLAIIYAFAFGLFNHFVPMPEQFKGQNANMLVEFPIFLILPGGVGALLGKYKPIA